MSSVREFLTIIEWFEKATNGGSKLFDKVEIIGTFRVCGGVIGLLLK